MYLTHNKGNSVVGERFIRTLKNKISKKRTVCNSRSNLDYLDKLVDEYNNIYHHCFDKKIIDADYSALTQQIEIN